MGEKIRSFLEYKWKYIFANMLIFVKIIRNNQKQKMNTVVKRFSMLESNNCFNKPQISET